MADNSPSPEEISDNPLNENGNAATVEEELTANGDGTSYTKEEFVKAKNQIADRLGRMKEDLAKVDTEDVARRAGEWVRENPLLAISIAAGAGILMGRGLVALLTPSPPPPLPERARRRARALASSAHDYLGDIGDTISSRAVDTGSIIKKKADEAGVELTRKAQEFSDELTRRASDVADAIAETAVKARESASDKAQELPDLLKEHAGQGRDFADSLLGTIKAATAALVVRRIGDWIRRA